jgi:hypothetical protein
MDYGVLMHHGAESKKSDASSAAAARQMPHKYVSGLRAMNNENASALPECNARIRHLVRLCNVFQIHGFAWGFSVRQKREWKRTMALKISSV